MSDVTTDVRWEIVSSTGTTIVCAPCQPQWDEGKAKAQAERQNTASMSLFPLCNGNGQRDWIARLQGSIRRHKCWRVTWKEDGGRHAVDYIKWSEAAKMWVKRMEEGTSARLVRVTTTRPWTWSEE